MDLKWGFKVLWKFDTLNIFDFFHKLAYSIKKRVKNDINEFFGKFFYLRFLGQSGAKWAHNEVFQVLLKIKILKL